MGRQAEWIGHEDNGRFRGGGAVLTVAGRRPPHSPASSQDEAADAAAYDSEALGRDWMTLWQSELAAISTDREVQETWQLLLAFWSAAAGTLMRGASALDPTRRSRHDGRRAAAAGHAGPAAAAGPAAPAAAPDAGMDAVGRLHDRIAELEQRLADLERGRGGGQARRPTGRAGRAKRP